MGQRGRPSAPPDRQMKPNETKGPGSMMRAGLLLASFLCLPLVAPGAQVNSEEAAAAVGGWLGLGSSPLGEPLGNRVKQIETFNDNAGGALYHVVYLDPSGFVVVSGDDSVEPIIAFASHGRFNPSADNPLGALIAGDVPLRVAQAHAGRAATLPASFLAARKKWQRLHHRSLEPPGPPSPTNSVSSVSDTRIAPLVQTLWNQSTANNGLACYNYYTPPYAAGTSSNYVCGCVATALAQVLRYFQYPTVGVGTNSFTIYIDGKSTTARLLGGNGTGGPYGWGNMPADPNKPSVIQCQAIGALTHDCGVAINMSFSANGSSASDYSAKMALLQTFMYSNAVYGENANSALFGPTMLAMVNANLDARLPVGFSIRGQFGSGTAGHEVVCDGYGYSLSTLYHHINLGWGGGDNAWYALPVIDTPDGYARCTNLNGCVYNIFTNGTGEIISGRVVSGDVPLPNVNLTAVRVGGGTYTATTDTNGIYALVHLPSASQYALTASKTAFITMSTNVATGTSSDSSGSSGNVWGVDWVLGVAPVCALTVPASGATVACGTVTLAANVTSNGVAITGVQFYCRSLKLGRLLALVLTVCSSTKANLFHHSGLLRTTADGAFVLPARENAFPGVSNT